MRSPIRVVEHHVNEFLSPLERECLLNAIDHPLCGVFLPPEQLKVTGNGKLTPRGKTLDPQSSALIAV